MVHESFMAVADACDDTSTAHMMPPFNEIRLTVAEGMVACTLARHHDMLWNLGPVGRQAIGEALYAMICAMLGVTRPPSNLDEFGRPVHICHNSSVGGPSGVGGVSVSSSDPASSASS